jgi:hypothetical protein
MAPVPDVRAAADAASRRSGPRPRCWPTPDGRFHKTFFTSPVTLSGLDFEHVTVVIYDHSHCRMFYKQDYNRK